MNNLKKTIEESLDEFDRKYGGIITVVKESDGKLSSFKSIEDIKNHLEESQQNIIKAVLEMVEEQHLEILKENKNTTINDYDDGASDLCYKLKNKFNQALKDE